MAAAPGETIGAEHAIQIAVGIEPTLSIVPA
jgi:hypothetical protein